MTVTFYLNNSENYRVTKNITSQGNYTCTLKGECSVENPSILINTSANISSYNYMYISEFGRYYFISDIVSVRNGVWLVQGHVDVLMTYSSEIKTCSATCKRQENLFNMYLDDPEFKTYNNADIVTKALTGGALNKNMSYVLVTAGG